MEESIKFITGKYSPAEAADILISVLNDKIKFHSLRSLNLTASDSSTRLNSEKRIEELTAVKKKVEKMVSQAHRENRYLDISSSINIKMVDPDEK